MKKINVTIICPGEEEYPGCADLLRTYPEVRLVAVCTTLDDAGLQAALKGSDVLLLDEAVIGQEGPEKVHAFYTNYPGLRTLLIIENDIENNVMKAVSLGMRGVMERTSMVSMLRKAITVLYSGEAWMSREVVKLLHYQSRYLDDRSVWLVRPDILPVWGKLN